MRILAILMFVFAAESAAARCVFNPANARWNCGPTIYSKPLHRQLLERDCKVIIVPNGPDRWNYPGCKKVMGF